MLTYRFCEHLTRCGLNLNKLEGFVRIHQRWFASAAAEADEVKQRLSASGDRFKPLPTCEDTFQRLLNEASGSPAGARVLKVAIVGAPNAGKSTLVNGLMGSKIVAVSKKVHTTEKRASAVLSEGDTQIIFVDTPGVVTAAEARRHRLSQVYLEDPVLSSEEADALVVVHDAACRWTGHRLDPNVLQLLERFDDKLSLLVLNKVDKVKSKRLLLDNIRNLCDGQVGGKPIAVSAKKSVRRQFEEQRVDVDKVAERYVSGVQGQVDEDLGSDPDPHELHDAENNETRGWPKFSSAFMVSSLSGDGLEEVKDKLFTMALPMPWPFHPAVTTDQNPKDLVCQLAREKFMNRLKMEMPYLLKFSVEEWKMVEDVFFIQLKIDAPKKHWCGHLIGPKGRTVAGISQELEQDLMNLFHCDLKLQLKVGSVDENKK